MEAAGAIGLIVNIAQLVEFSYNIINEGYSLAHNSHGELEGRIALSLDLQDLQNDVLASVQTYSGHQEKANRSDDQKLQVLAQKACEVSQSLAQALNKYRLPRDEEASITRELRGVKRAFFFRLKKKDLDVFRAQLDELRSQLDTRFLKQIRSVTS